MRIVNNLIPYCRNCESTNVVRIEEKQTQLIQTYKSIIANTRVFLTPLDELEENLIRNRNTLLQAREDIPKCFHYPTLESEFLLTLRLFEKARGTAGDQMNRYFQDVQRNLNYITEIPITHPSNLTYITEILKHFDREREKVEETIRNQMEQIRGRFQPLLEKIAFMSTMQTQFASFLTKMQLEPEEKIVYSLKCKLATGTNNLRDYSNKNGTILLTSKRLYFFHEQGLLNKKTVELFSVKLEDLQQAGVKGKLKKTVSLEFLNSMYAFSLSKELRETLIGWVEKARIFDTFLISDAEYKKLGKYKIQTRLYHDELENIIYGLVGFHGSTYQINDMRNGNAVVNSQMYRTTHLPGPQAQPMNSWAAPEFAEPLTKPTMSSAIPTPVPTPFFSVPQRFSPQHADPFKTMMTPAGHYGYPHDHTNPMSSSTDSSPMESSEYNFTPSNPPYPPHPPRRVPLNPTFQSRPAFTPPSFASYEDPPSGKSFVSGPATGYSGIKSFNASPYQGTYTAPNPPRKPSFTSDYSQEFQIHSDLQQLQQEAFALTQTIRKLEQQFEAGQISNPEFVKSYKELQRELFRINTQINQGQKYLEETSDLNS